MTWRIAPIDFECHSWLLDDQLARYLPESSNIVQFQLRFRLLPYDQATSPPSDNTILSYAVNLSTDGPVIPSELLDEFPQDTTLQRAFVVHLRSGGHWYERTGWLPLQLWYVPAFAPYRHRYVLGTALWRKRGADRVLHL